MRLCSTNQVTEESSCFWVSGHFTRCWSLTQSRTNSLLMSTCILPQLRAISLSGGYKGRLRFHPVSVWCSGSSHLCCARCVFAFYVGIGGNVDWFCLVVFTPGAEEVNKTQFVLSWANVFVYEGNDTRFKQTALTLEVSWTTCFHQFLLLSFSLFPSSPGGSEHIWPQHYTFSQTSKPSLFSEHSSVV